MAMAKHAGGAAAAGSAQQNFGVWVSRDEWKKQQVELKRGAEAYNQLLQVRRPFARPTGLDLCSAERPAPTVTPLLRPQEIEKKDRSIEALRTQCTEHLEARRAAEQQVRAPLACSTSD